MITAVQAWPSFFAREAAGEPGAGPGGLLLEKATPASFAADMAALVQSSSRVTLREPQEAPEHAYFPDAEWT